MVSEGAGGARKSEPEVLPLPFAATALNSVIWTKTSPGILVAGKELRSPSDVYKGRVAVSISVFPAASVY